MMPRSVGVFSREEVIGDGLYKVVFLRGLRAAFPDAVLTWMVAGRTVFAGALRAVVGPPLLDRVVEHCGIGVSPGELLRAVPAGLGPFDLLIDTQGAWWRTLSLRRVPHGRMRTASWHRRGLGGAAVGPHVLDRLFALLETGAGRAVPRDTSPLVLPPGLVAAAEAALPGDGRGRVAVAPGAGGAVKCWPRERFVALARGQAERGRQVVFLLGPAEAGWRERLAEEVPGALFPEEHPAFAAVLPEGGAQPLRAVAVAGRCAAGVANDSGAGHMIAAAGTPLVSLFGPKPPERFRPVVARCVALRAQDYGGEEVGRIPLPAVEGALEGLLG